MTSNRPAIGDADPLGCGPTRLSGSTDGSAPAAADTPTRPGSMWRVAAASCVGSMIEWYDFFIYGFAAALVFGKVFFPALGTAAATVASFATLGVAFVARPIGAIVFGHFGDRLGRKKTLIASLLMMGLSTVLVGLIPTANEIGVAAPVLLVVLRIVQGLAAGGEWAGAALFAAENAPAGKRGFWAMFASLGGGLALALAPATFLVAGIGMSDDAFAGWGWRLPFLASFALIGVGLWIRLRMTETPVFELEMARGPSTRVPFIEALKRQPLRIIFASGTMIIVAAFGYTGATYFTNYGTSTLGLGRTVVLSMSTLGGLCSVLGILVGGAISDRFGRRRVVLVTTVLGIVWAPVLFPILDSGSLFLFGVGIAVTMFINGYGLGPMSAYMSELFDTRYRYTAAGLSYNFATIIGGGIVPILAVAITAAFGGFVFSILLAGLAVVSMLCALALPETRSDELYKLPEVEST
ncbi:MFS transporter [Nocardia sp. R6R-6]|uniref:MFS transporter n=1 Tax=Nocardia sp. R6R-6 TaxID=3459303 RepID=UPI00403DB6A0